MWRTIFLHFCYEAQSKLFFLDLPQIHAANFDSIPESSLLTMSKKKSLVSGLLGKKGTTLLLRTPSLPSIPNSLSLSLSMTVSFRRRRHCPYLAPQNTTTTSLDATRLFSIPIWRGTKTSEQVQVKDFFRAISQQWICLSETSINLPFSELDRGRKKACTKNTALHSAPQLQGLFTIVHVPDEWWDV